MLLHAYSRGSSACEESQSQLPQARGENRSCRCDEGLGRRLASSLECRRRDKRDKSRSRKASVFIDDLHSCIGDTAIGTRVADVLKSTNITHIACHGTQDAADAHSSGFCLSDGNLTVSHLMDLDLKDAFFAFLSACETAKGDEKQPDQTIHLAAAMLFVGFRSVVATMWWVFSLHYD
jgi:hypothetical protein